MVDDQLQAFQHGAGDDRLGHEFVDAGVARLGQFGGGRVAGDHDHRRQLNPAARRASNGLDEGDAVHRRHFQVGQDNVDRAIPEDPQALAAVGGLGDLRDADRPNNLGEQQARVPIVVHDQQIQTIKPHCSTTPGGNEDAGRRPPLNSAD